MKLNPSPAWLTERDGFLCPSCGRRHFGGLRDCAIGKNALSSLPVLLKKYGSEKPFVLCDRNTYAAAGEKAVSVLASAGIPCVLHVVERERPAPDERIVGEAVMYCPADCDAVIAVGSGVLNDTGKILAAARKIPDLVVGTAPSMDGYASGTSSMERGGLKVSLPSKCPDAVIAEPEILASAPVHMIRSGIGDMLAKYVSLAEWKIAAFLVGDFYCETAAKVTEGLVVSGLAMNYAGISRPASGMEHYISHILDMRALAFGTPSDLHGIQCGIATLEVVRAYEKLAKIAPDREKALRHAREFDPEQWKTDLRERLGPGAEAMIRGEEKEGKYDPGKHAARLEKILSGWDGILSVITELPPSGELEAFMKRIGHPVSFAEIGVSEEDARDAFRLAPDIRDKYVLGRLLWDLGLTEEFC